LNGEMEIEGTEEFVRDHFERLLAIHREMVMEESKRQRSAARRAGQSEKRDANGGAGRTRTGRGPQGVKALVMNMLEEAGEQGISSAELQEKTGLAPRQIWSIIYRAEREGKVTKEGRGQYRIL